MFIGKLMSRILLKVTVLIATSGSDSIDGQSIILKNFRNFGNLRSF
jgi:hypothetical protein